MDLGQKAYRMKTSISAKLSLYGNVLVECNLEKHNTMLEIVLSYTLEPIFTISEVKQNKMLSENSSCICGKIPKNCNGEKGKFSVLPGTK